MEAPNKSSQTVPSPDDVRKQVSKNRKLLEEIYQTVEKTRKYFLITMIINIVVFALPLVIALILVPTFLDTYLNQLQL